MPDSARLMLSQVKPHMDVPKYEGEPFIGYCFLADGRYSAGIRLDSPAEAVAYAQMQAAYQSKVLICASDDCAVMEIRDGVLTYPAPEEPEIFRQEQAF